LSSRRELRLPTSSRGRWGQLFGGWSTGLVYVNSLVRAMVVLGGKSSKLSLQGRVFGLLGFSTFRVLFIRLSL